MDKVSRHRRSGVRAKILGGFLAMVVVTVAVSAVAISRTNAASESAARIYDESALPLQHLGALREASALTRNALSTMPGALDAETVDTLMETMEAQHAAADAAAAALRDSLTSDEELALVDEFQDAWNGYMDIAENVLVPLAQAGETERWWAEREAILPFAGRVSDALRTLTENEVAKSAELRDDAAATADTTRTILIGAGVLAAVLAVLLGLRIASRISTPLRRTVEVLDKVAGGDFTQRLQIDSGDEVGQLGKALNETLERTGSALTVITQSAGLLAVSSEELAAVSTQMGATADTTSAQADAVAAAADEVSSHVDTVAVAGEEMGASVREIAGSAAEAAKVASTAVELTGGVNETMAKLSESSLEIGEVVQLITSIAEQTNLLALNATIEAARAGEAGKGFAVVANEVKELAKETATATDQISARITAIQGDASAAAQAIVEIASVIEQIHGIQATIASAVEEQSVTTSEISRSVSEAAGGSGRIASTIAEVAASTRETSTGAAGVREAAGDLAKLADELADLVGQFKVTAAA